MFRVCFRLCGEKFHKAFETEYEAREFAEKLSLVVNVVEVRQRVNNGINRFTTIAIYKDGKEM